MATIAAIASIAGSLATIGTSVAGSVKQSKALDSQEAAQRKQLQEEKKAREQARKAALAGAGGGFSGTILAPSGLGGQQAASAGKGTLLGGA